MSSVSQVVSAWNGMAIGAFAVASRALTAETSPAERQFPVEGCQPKDYLDIAIKVNPSLLEMINILKL